MSSYENSPINKNFINDPEKPEPSIECDNIMKSSIATVEAM